MVRLWLFLPFSALCFLQFIHPSTSKPSDDSKPGEEQTGCVAPPEWFQEGGTREADYTKDLDPDNDCDFYRFAWQTFLFVTDPDKGETQPRLLNFATPEEVFGKSASVAFPHRSKAGDLVLSPRVTKKMHSRDVDTIFQAISDGVVIDRNGRAIYYGLHMNDTFVKFIVKNNLNTPNGIAKADKTLEFEAGCLEFKSSWRVIGDKEDTSTFITRMARLPTLVIKDNKILIDTSKPRDEKVALVGLHVVGVAKGHPEFIWSTFEHLKNAPDLPVDLINVVQTNPAWKKPVTDKLWTFCPKGTPAIECNIKNNDSDNPVKLVDAAKQTLSPITPLFRHYAFGGDDPRGIHSLNASVHEKLPAKDLRRNYELIGAVWIDKPKETFKEDKFFDDDVLAGATKLSSSTMETFTQNTNSQRNCFGCHRTKREPVPNTDPPITLDPKRINVSHMILRAFSHGRQAEALEKKKGK